MIAQLLTIWLIQQSPQAKNCIPVLLYDPTIPSDAPHVTLNMDGSWTVPSWRSVQDLADNAPAALARCIARELLRQRKRLNFNAQPNNSCSLFGDDAAAAMESVTELDPVMQACSATGASIS